MTKEQKADILENVLLGLFQKSEPNIYKVRDCLTRLAKLTKKPNTSLVGEWIIFWCSREYVVDRVFGTGATGGDEWWMQLQEYLLRISTKKEGRTVKAAEVIRRVGPFANSHNTLKGTYSTKGTNGLRIVFNEIKDGQGEDIELKDGSKEKVVELDVIYSSKKMIAMQSQDESEECDFFVFTPVDDVEAEVGKLLGLERARFLFN